MSREWPEEIIRCITTNCDFCKVKFSNCSCEDHYLGISFTVAVGLEVNCKLI